MDHRWPRAAILILIAATGPSLPIREAAWTLADQRVEALSTHPSACLMMPKGSAAMAQIMAGRAAFHTPTLLGGQAARAGLSCASCHTNGRGNPHFTFPGVSGAPGTADVTSSIMSKKRGDGLFNPKPIPDLALDTPKVPRDPARPELRAFIRGLVVEEFDGPDPTAAVLDGLTAYVRSLSPADCGTPSPVTLAAALTETIDATEVALRLWTSEDEESARFMIAAARASLGRIHERFAGADVAKERKQIEKLDARLGALQASIDRGSGNTNRKIAAWQQQFARSRPALTSAEARSLYARDRLAAALGN